VESVSVSVESVFTTLMTIFVLLATSGISAELFRYRGAARDGGTLEYVFDSDDKSDPSDLENKRIYAGAWKAPVPAECYERSS
jgi:hypothetical protein